MHLHTYLSMLTEAEHTLARAYRQIATGHSSDADVAFACIGFARECDSHAAALAPVRDRYANQAESAPDRLYPAAPGPARGGPIGLLRDLADLHQLASFVESTWELVGQAAQAARDRELIDLAADCPQQTTAQVSWIVMRMKADAAQTLLAAR
jgi:hypothetical protein